MGGCRGRLIAYLLGPMVLLLMGVGRIMALEPEEVLVIANRNASQSVGLARYYMKRRGIPKSHLLQLWITDKETCTREDYNKRVVPAVRNYLNKNDPQGNIRCLVTMYGLPLKISPPAMSREQREEVQELRNRRKMLAQELKALKKQKPEKGKELRKKLEEIRGRIRLIEKQNWRSSFDSELSLVRVEKYPLEGWIPNPYFLAFQRRDLEIKRAQVLMVSRLDGPSPEIVKRLVDDAVAVEKTGLRGTAYFDARWPRPGREKMKKLKGYAFYDASIHAAAEVVKRSGRLQVVVDDRQALFQPGQCPNAALYCGWYSLAHYVPAFTWVRGAVGYHIASSECATLHAGSSQVWCKRMLEEGVAATLGPVGEPYVQAFPVPEVFFGLLVRGRLTLAECYMVSLPFLSWQMVLVGDPLYRPFKVNAIKFHRVRPGP